MTSVSVAITFWWHVMNPGMETEAEQNETETAHARQLSSEDFDCVFEPVK